jgi:dethiobiotin synthetase
MSGRLVVVSGTGTDIGKTHFCEALLLALGRRGVQAVGLKPVETGAGGPRPSDASRLEAASSFHVKHSGVRFEDPVSPHLASREAGRPISIEALAAELLGVTPLAEVTVAELAGGLFSPLTETETNADLARLLQPDVHVLVAPDRLGVLHDLIAATRAAAAMALRIDGIVLVAPEHTDTSTTRNAAEIPRLLTIPVLASLPRASAAVLARSSALEPLVARITAWAGASVD